MWGILPTRSYFFNRTSRWTLGARDIMFTNPLSNELASIFLLTSSHSIYSAFFRNGKVLDTVRGGGIYQGAVDLAIDKLNKGDWVRPMSMILTQ
jgi:monolysocardiolipin acyltransferase